MQHVMPVHALTKVTGVFADPVEHTLSPPMQNRAFSAMGLSYIYVPWHVTPERLPQAVEAIRALELAGVNCTIPHKVAVIDLLDEVTDTARLIGAVNTIENRDGRLIGHNTDAPGFQRSLEEEAGVQPQGRRFLLLGAGGAARAIGVQMVLAGAAAVMVANRTLEKARELADLLAGLGRAQVAAVRLDPDAAEFQRAVRAADILINTTPAGMYPRHHEPPLVSARLLQPGQLVCDIVYTPRRTALLAEAEKAGCATLPGLGMLAYQGAIAIEIWTGQKAPVAVMKEALEEALRAREQKE